MRRALIASLVVSISIAGATLAQAKNPHTIYGTRHADRINGNTEQDAGTHGNPSQTIYAKAGNDVVFGGKGRDYIYGGKGADKLNAFHASRGLLNGGPGRDRCVIGDNSNVDVRSCEQVVVRDSQGNGGQR